MSKPSHFDQAINSIHKKPFSSNRCMEPLPFGLTYLKSEKCQDLALSVELPALCCVFQGSIEINQNDQSRSIETNEPTIFCKENMPYKITLKPHSEPKPAIAVLFRLDMQAIQSMKKELSAKGFTELDLQESEPNAMREIVQSLARLIGLMERPIDQTVLAPLMVTEIHFQIARSHNYSAFSDWKSKRTEHCKIANALMQIDNNLNSQLNVKALARDIGMSLSSFHAHFKNETGLSPLQYHKNNKLERAREQLRAGRSSVSSIAYDLGYESPSQFSREYTRKFGFPPQTDLIKSKRSKV